MNALLIIVIFNFETGSEVETRMDFEDVAACHAAALDAFRAVDEHSEVNAMDVPAGQKMLDGTMIAYGTSGSEIGMYACNALRSTERR